MESDSIFVIWIVVALVMTLASLAYVAWRKEDDFEAFFIIILTAFMWPAILTVVAVVAPFWVFYQLIVWLRGAYDAIEYSSKE
jgi:hypothetical protein